MEASWIAPTLTFIVTLLSLVPIGIWVVPWYARRKAVSEMHREETGAKSDDFAYLSARIHWLEKRLSIRERQLDDLLWSVDREPSPTKQRIYKRLSTDLWNSATPKIDEENGARPERKAKEKAEVE